MKKLVFFATLLCASTLFGQMSPEKVHYRLKINTVTTEDAAKNLSNELRKYFDALPLFSDADDQFTVSSNILITEEQLSERLAALGFDLLFFEQRQGVEILNTKH